VANNRINTVLEDTLVKTEVMFVRERLVFRSSLFSLTNVLTQSNLNRQQIPTLTMP